MGCDTYLIRSTENSYDSNTKTSQITEQIIWEGRGADIGIAAARLLDDNLRGVVDLEQLTTFAEEIDDGDLAECIQIQHYQTDFSLDETDYRLEISY